MVGSERGYIDLALASGHLSGAGDFTARCQSWLADRFASQRTLLTHSATAALEMAALLSGVGPGDEVIMPAFTFVSTANAFVLRGATPVLVDVDPATQNLDPAAVAAAITSRTRVIVPVHYAGMPCAMDEILALAAAHDLLVIEDAAQAHLARWRDRPLGSLGHLAALSFHETKNLHCGEGGALLINDPRFVDRAEIIWEKGTDRRRFFRGQVDKYRWVDLGSSFLPSELSAAFLWAQLEAAEAITTARLAIWHRYHEALRPLAERGLVALPATPSAATPNGHIFYLVVRDLATRSRLLSGLAQRGVQAVFHYVPLHQSPAGARFCRVSGSLAGCERAGDQLLRLPLWIGLDEPRIRQVVDAVSAVLDADT